MEVVIILSSIIRVEKNKNYVVLNRTVLNDERLSWKAKGIMAYMLSMPDDWTFYAEEIAKHSKDGIDSLRSGMKELKEFEYLKRFPVKDQDTNKITGWETVIYEIPQTEKPQTEKPHMEKPHMEKPHMENHMSGNPTLLSTDELSTDLNQVLNEPSIDIKNKLSCKQDYARQAIEYLNLKANKRFSHTTSKTAGFLNARYDDGYTLDQVKQVIDKKVHDWLNKKEMCNYLRPQTLFNPTNFEAYLNEGTVEDEKTRSGNGAAISPYAREGKYAGIANYKSQL